MCHCHNVSVGRIKYDIGQMIQSINRSLGNFALGCWIAYVVDEVCWIGYAFEAWTCVQVFMFCCPPGGLAHRGQPPLYFSASRPAFNCEREFVQFVSVS